MKQIWFEPEDWLRIAGILIFLAPIPVGFIIRWIFDDILGW